jgi:1,3-beta-glucanosyltransferase GAS5
MNVYLHCTGNLQSIDEIVGFKTLLDDFTSFQLNIPVILTEFGCISSSFPTLGDYQAQRDWLQVDALFDDSYEAEFAGGFAFEYNTELVYSKSPFPFTQYGEGNFGIGYFTPVDCDATNITCSYVPFPQFDTLASKYAAVDMVSGPTMDSYVPPDRPYTQCPSEFPLQSAFQWPAMADIACPEDLTVICPNIPDECATSTHPKSSNTTTTPPGGTMNVTTNPTTLLEEPDNVTNTPSIRFSDAPTSSMQTNDTTPAPTVPVSIDDQDDDTKGSAIPSSTDTKPSKVPSGSPSSEVNRKTQRPSNEAQADLEIGSSSAYESSCRTFAFSFGITLLSIVLIIS